jgi:hypothetical protein
MMNLGHHGDMSRLEAFHKVYLPKRAVLVEWSPGDLGDKRRKFIRTSR